MYTFVSLCFVLVICAASYKGYEGNYKVSTTNQEDEKGCRFVEVRLDHGDKELWDVNTIQSSGSTITKMTPRWCDTGDIKTVRGGDIGGELVTTKDSNNKKCSSPRLTCPSQAALTSLGYEHIPSEGFFKIYSPGMKWDEAKKKCERDQAHLVVAKSEEQVLAVLDFIDKKWHRGLYWFGFNDMDKEGHFVTIFNETLESSGYNTWLASEPNVGVGENCGAIKYDDAGQYGLVDAGYEELWDVNTIQSTGSTTAKITPRRCETSGIKTVRGGDVDGEPNTTKVISISNNSNSNNNNNNKCFSPRLTCPSQAALTSLGYELIPSTGYFKIHKYGPKWEDAKKKCEEEQAHLVVAKSVAQVLALLDFINRKGSRGAYWVGFSDKDKEGHYVTVFNQTLEAAGYNTWMVGEPNGGVTQNCGLLFYNGEGKYGLGDHDCNSTAWFICEIEDFLVFEILNNRGKITINSTGNHQVRLDHGDEELWDVNTIQSTGSTIAKITPHRCKTGGIKTVRGGDVGGEPETTKVISISSSSNQCSSPRLICPSQAALTSLGYELIPSIGYFKIHKYGPKWEEAKKKCEEEQAHLVVAKSAAQVLALLDFINRKGSRGFYWVGFSDKDKEGHYVTVFNQTLEAAGYNTWMVGEPNSGVTQNCGVLFYNSQGQYGLGDHDCNSAAWFICEIEDV
ncbi:hypothetical protein C0J52_14357 [Blattella germanica]|nr:hypothetical protein C0J52_14357 [Blattella germanica]